MAMGPMVKFVHAGKRYSRCKGCGLVGLEGWAHMHGKDVDGHEYGQNWYRTVAELDAAVNQPAPRGPVVGTVAR